MAYAITANLLAPVKERLTVAQLDYNIYIIMSKEIIRLAKGNDLSPLMEGVNLAKEQLFFHQSGQWQKGEPSEETLRNDIQNGQYFVMEWNQIIVGGMALLFHEPAYENLRKGAWLNKDPYGVLHRFFIHPAYQRRGYALQLFEEAKQRILQCGLFNCRVDTHVLNVPMRKTLIKAGFLEVGEAFLPGAGERLVYHKVYE